MKRFLRLGYFYGEKQRQKKKVVVDTRTDARRVWRAAEGHRAAAPSLVLTRRDGETRWEGEDEQEEGFQRRSQSHQLFLQ